MPNGVMAGDGSKGNPFIVMDGYDFNAIRSITTSASDFKYIELGADINLSMYVSFVPIPVKYLNIDGKGHTITEINIITSDTTVGLFASLYVSEYVKDLTIEGVLVCNTTSTISSGGAFCGRMYLQTDAIISNVEVYFSLTFSTTSGVSGVGGMVGTLEISGRSNSAVRECAFKGTMDISSTSTSTSYSMIIGGLIGQLYSSNPNAADTLVLDRCYTQAAYRVNNRLDMRMGGIFGDMRHGYNTSTACYQVVVSQCVAHVSMRLTHTSAVTTGTHRVSGIACYAGYSNSQVTTLDKCVAFIDVHWLHAYAVNAFRMAGLLFIGTSSSQVFTINQGYAVMRMLNPDILPWTGIGESLGSVTYLPSSTPAVRVNDAFFDKEVFAAHYDGVFTETHGITTAELKSAAFLTGKGWEFDE